ncbi:hypothetical protein PSPO_b0115 [Pseudoalteromonas spongiae UST010723-006]|nr:hypothetical protein PSPO_b0115 [Pseudoalteromonas spongiae UST010723-006]
MIMTRRYISYSSVECAKDTAVAFVKRLNAASTRCSLLP